MAIAPDQLEIIRKEHVDFMSRSRWNKSKRNPHNRWRDWDGMRLVIFQRSTDERWGWLIADAEENEYSPDGFESRQDAMNNLRRRLHVGR